MPGPRAKPPELKLLEGNRGHRPINLDQMFRPEVGVPDRPADLSKDARAAWNRLRDELIRYNLLSRVDRDAFVTLCRTVGRLEQLERAITAKQKLLLSQGADPTDALMDVTPNGLRIQSALYQILNKEQDKLRYWLDSFGLKPDARAKVTTAIRAQLKLFEGGEGATPSAEPGQADDTPPGDGFEGFE
jgi:P27 family predicted phage terminase small subunit